jgi:hypothetical protein
MSKDWIKRFDDNYAWWQNIDGISERRYHDIKAFIASERRFLLSEVRERVKARLKEVDFYNPELKKWAKLTDGEVSRLVDLPILDMEKGRK